MSKVYLPAGAHKLWVAYFDTENLRTLGDRDQVASVVLVEPVIGWMVRDEGDDEDLPLPLTPDFGLLDHPGYRRRIGPSDVGVRKEMVEVATGLLVRWAMEAKDD